MLGTLPKESQRQTIFATQIKVQALAGTRVFPVKTGGRGAEMSAYGGVQEVE
jgi:hypothetical protein